MQEPNRTLLTLGTLNLKHGTNHLVHLDLQRNKETVEILDAQTF